MAGTQRTGFTDAALVRLLAQLDSQAAPGAPADFADRLSGWLRWTDAQPLFAALQEPLTVAPPSADEDTSVEGAEADCRSVHALLTRAFVADAPWREAPRPRTRLAAGRLPPPPMEPLEFPIYRRHYQSQQIAMEDRIAPLRARLRRVLQLRSPAMARLAALDQVMERVLSEPESRLLGALPAQLEKRFQQLRSEAAAATTGHPAPADAAPGWEQRFQQELDAMLLAELDLRWHPIQGLLAALRTPL